MFNENQEILACSSCGETFAVERDLNSSGEKLITNDKYLVKDLTSLQLTINEKREYINLSSVYRCVKSVYPVWTGTDYEDETFLSTTFYHLHPNLVDLEGRCHLCRD